MTVPIYQVDTFTNRPFSGNPAAVCLLPDEADDHWQQAMAAEMNLSETAFVRPHEDGFRLRWFTPETEVDLCGHATLASAHVLWREEDHPLDKPIRFYTKSGLLTSRCVEDEIEMDFPVATVVPTPPPTGLLEALGCEVVEVMQARTDYLIRLGREEDVHKLRPGMEQLRNIPARGFIVTATSHDPAYDFVSRFFAPAVGINEDPVTGSAHCALGPYWSAVLGKQALMARQVSKRGGTLKLRLKNDRILIRGQARTVFKGSLYGK